MRMSVSVVQQCMPVGAAVHVIVCEAVSCIYTPVLHDKLGPLCHFRWRMNKNELLCCWYAFRKLLAMDCAYKSSHT
jgi:hypothetical protein